MKRARYLVFFELCFVGLWCLAAFLFAIFVLDGGGIASKVLALAQIGLTLATLLVTHLTLRTVFRRGSDYEPAAIARSTAFRAVPVVVLALGLFHLLLLQASPEIGAFGWDYTWSTLIYVFGLALGWHLVTAWLLARAPGDEA